MNRQLTLTIDGNNTVHRTFHVAKHISKRNGDTDQDSITGLHLSLTLNSIFSVVKQFNPNRIFIAWDEKLDGYTNIRKDQYSDYKGNRSNDATPHENNSIIKELLKCLGINSIYPRHREADDVITYIVKTHNSTNHVIVSADHDFLQLVDDNTSLFDPIRKKLYTIATFEQDTGWKKSEWLRAKCCLGDSSDNVKGLHRFGAKKVRKVIDGDIQLTQEQKDIVSRNLKLFDLNEVMSDDVECQYYEQQLCQEQEYDWDKFMNICKEHKLNKILKDSTLWHNSFIMPNKLFTMLS